MYVFIMSFIWKNYHLRGDKHYFQPYEYVKLHQQPPDRRRPIVLIGPRNVGRYELRDKLTNDKYEEFCVPIAHTSRSKKDGETNGQDYMFVSKDQFEQHKKVQAANFLFL